MGRMACESFVGEIMSDEQAIKVHSDDVLRLVGNVFYSSKMDSTLDRELGFRNTFRFVLSTLEENGFEVISTYGH